MIVLTWRAPRSSALLAALLAVACRDRPPPAPTPATDSSRPASIADARAPSRPLAAGKRACPPEGEGGFADPAAAYQASLRALQRRDFCALLRTYSPRARRRVIQQTARALAYGVPAGAEATRDEARPQKGKAEGQPGQTRPLQQRFLEVLRKHGVVDPGSITTSAEGRAWERLIDEEGLYADLLTVFAGALPRLAAGKLRHLTVDGDRARAEATTSVGGEQISQPIRFRRVNGRWYLHERRDRF